MTYWVRWVAVLPAAVAAYLGIQIVVAVGNSFGPGPEFLVNIYCQLINSIAGPICFVLAGTKTAPAHRFGTAITLTVVFSGLSGALLTVALLHPERLSMPVWWLAISAVLGLASTIGTCIYIHEEEAESLTQRPQATAGRSLL